MRPRRVLLPVDLSATSELGVRQGAQLARTLALPVEVLHVVAKGTTPSPAIEPVAEADSASDLARLKLSEQRLRDWLASLGLPEVDSFTRRIEEGDPAALILASAREDDLLVLGTHGRRGVGHLLFGSVAERVVRKTPCPVVTVRPGAQRSFSAAPHILVAADLSPTSQAALELARQLQSALHGHLSLLYVSASARTPTGQEVSFTATGSSRGPLQDWARAQAAQELDAFLGEARALVPHEVLLGDPIDCILGHAERTKAELLVIGTHGRSGLSHLLVGSVAEELLRRAPCPVMIFRATA